MSNHILFVFEGIKTEQNITDSLSKYFIQDADKTLIRASYGFNIYRLYEKLYLDSDQDLLELLKIEISKKTKISVHDQALLDLEGSESISDIYLFFDYDCHCTNANDEKLSKMLALFNDSMAHGLLCISYPMVESIKHQTDNNPIQKLHSISELTNYKSYVNQSGNANVRYQNWALYDLNIWSEIINVNLHRANLLVEERLRLPSRPLEQEAIFNAQLAQHIPSEQIAIISSFPLMLHQYYGKKLFERI